jgi:hypothetical protein
VAYFLTREASGAFLKSVIGYSGRKVMTIGGNNYHLYAARIADIIVHDHVIIDKNRFFSFRESLI